MEGADHVIDQDIAKTRYNDEARFVLVTKTAHCDLFEVFVVWEMSRRVSSGRGGPSHLSGTWLQGTQVLGHGFEVRTE